MLYIKIAAYFGIKQRKKFCINNYSYVVNVCK